MEISRGVSVLWVHLAAVADLHDKNAQSAVLDVADDSVITGPVLPELAQLGAFKGFPDAARIVKMFNTFEQKRQKCAGQSVDRVGQGFSVPALTTQLSMP